MGNPWSSFAELTELLKTVREINEANKESWKKLAGNISETYTPVDLESFYERVQRVADRFSAKKRTYKPVAETRPPAEETAPPTPPVEEAPPLPETFDGAASQEYLKKGLGSFLKELRDEYSEKWATVNTQTGSSYFRLADDLVSPDKIPDTVKAVKIPKAEGEYLDKFLGSIGVKKMDEGNFNKFDVSDYKSGAVMDLDVDGVLDAETKSELAAVAGGHTKAQLDAKIGTLTANIYRKVAREFESRFLPQHSYVQFGGSDDVLETRQAVKPFRKSGSQVSMLKAAGVSYVYLPEDWSAGYFGSMLSFWGDYQVTKDIGGKSYDVYKLKDFAPAAPVGGYYALSGLTESLPETAVKEMLNGAKST